MKELTGLIFLIGLAITLIVVRGEIIYDPDPKQGIRLTAAENVTTVFQHNKTVVCYATVEFSCYVLNDWKQFTADLSPPKLCTHLILSFARLRVTRGKAKIDPSCFLRRASTELPKLREGNPLLKILLSLGEPLEGGVDGRESVISQLYNLAKDPRQRKELVDNAVKVLQANTLDGLDIYFPGNRDPLHDNHSTEVVQLFKEIRKEFDKHPGLLFTAAFGPREITAETSVVKEVVESLDMVQLIAYDYHLFGPEVTAYSAPLGKVIATLSDYLEKGVPEDKIVLGIQTYGRTYRFREEFWEGPRLGTPAGLNGVTSYGIQWRNRGYYLFGDIFEDLEAFPERRNMRVYWDEEAVVPFCYFGLQWYSFENTRSLTKKVELVRLLGLRGVMVF